MDNGETSKLVELKTPAVPANHACDPARLRPPEQRERHAFYLRILVFLGLYLSRWPAGGDSAVAAQMDAGGYAPRQAFEGGVSEDINLYNLNLLVALPLSPTYPVTTALGNRKLSYGLTAYYNGALQWSTDGTVSGYGKSLGNPAVFGWLGAGWRLDFGNFIESPARQNGQCVTMGGAWVSPGGAVHPFNGDGADLYSTLDGSDVWVDGSEAMPQPDDNCNEPTVLYSRDDKLYRTLNKNTGQVTKISDVGSPENYVQISYMKPNDFDPNGIEDPNSYNYNSPFPEIKEQTRAIKQVVDSRGRTITTTLSKPLFDDGVNKFLLTQIQAPVFGDPNGTASGIWRLVYEARTISTPPPGWPNDANSFSPITLPFLVRVEVPEGLTYHFDYDAWGEMSEIRTPAGARTVYGWGDEFVSDTGNGSLSPYPLRRVLKQKRLEPFRVWQAVAGEPGFGNESLTYDWFYTHNWIPQDATASPCGVHDPWRTIVTDPGGNDTVHRFYSAQNPPPSRSTLTYTPPGLPAATRYYKGHAKRWVDGASLFLTHVDPNYPVDGELVRASYYRYNLSPLNPNNNSFGPPLHLLGTQTVFYDDPLDPAPTYDPNATDTRCMLNAEVEAILDPPLVVTPDGIEGWACRSSSTIRTTGLPWNPWARPSSRRSTGATSSALTRSGRRATPRVATRTVFLAAGGGSSTRPVCSRSSHRSSKGHAATG